MAFSDLFSLKTLKGQAKRYLEVFMREPLAFRVKAEPGWRAVLFAPRPDSEDIDIDIIPVEEWGLFTSLKFPEETDAEYRDGTMLRKNQEATFPIIPDSYMHPSNSSPLRQYFKSLEVDYPSWNMIPPPSLIFGCLSPADTRSVEDIEAFVRKTYKKMKDSVETLEALQKNMGSSSDVENAIGEILGKFKVDKSKLN